MSHKSKGINAERELIHAFWNNSWSAVRIAGSGSSRYPSPDVLAGNGSRRIAIECKASKDTAKYLTAKEVGELQTFAELFGAEAWIGMRFDDMKWYFLSLEDLKASGKSFSVSIELAKKKGLKFEELIEI
ncbi:Holliday junction resolvase [Candidatus Woesearchaeota archaeon]|nr:Holliday junction resolvase [Candidatus Woesearchaeota archaeon]|tara:strand:- start:12592 stop:12981 length:390 start_codon:yes stop_codon:yes gene_type:complete